MAQIGIKCMSNFTKKFLDQNHLITMPTALWRTKK